MGEFAISNTGLGRLFTDPDPDKARAHFRSKSRVMSDKLMTVGEAVSKFVKDWDYLAIGGFGTNRIPTAVLHEILRQGKRELGLSGHTATHDFQIMAAGGVLNRVDVAYVVGLEARGLSRVARNLFEEAKIEVCEWTNAALAWRYRAAAMGVPFIPARVMFGTDTFKYSAAKEMICPFTGKKLLALPALYPDVAIIHVHRSDKHGNAQIDGITVSDFDVARAARKVILSAERIIENDEIRKEPSKTLIPYYCVDAVCHVPYGSFPGNMPYEYFSDEDHLKEWLSADGHASTLEPFLSKYVFGTLDFGEYLDLCGGEERLGQLRSLELK
ncbi:MAG TPA: CoA transferase subunit A [Firmicutes bacterium]|jgi:glutaconate CoA-transferase subunit A|nr:CoA transferase subunit A [Bacillota bacterium]